MQTKVCYQCKRELPATTEYFYKNKGHKDGLSSMCKECQHEYDVARKEQRKEYHLQRYAMPEVQEYHRNYNKIHYTLPETKEYHRLYSIAHSEENKQYQKEYYKTHKEQKKQYQERNKERKRIYDKKYRLENADKIRKHRDSEHHKMLVKKYNIENADKIKQYNKQRYENNKIGKLFSNAMCYALKGAKAGRHWEDLVPYNLQELREHLEKQFTPEMSWNNYGSYWEVDHIIPQNTFNISSAEDRDFQICWSLANLRPLSISDNRSRPKDGSDIDNDIKMKILHDYIVN